MELGKNLEEKREDLCFTQKEVANILHVSRQTVSNWERDVSYPDLESLVSLSDLYHISVDNLLDHTI
ncbi:helix-turn-helix domain-containing protein [Ligilactobacillus cholophilus]|uniref:helix-turn-helix domain-containing protein n=1 Tax=Ligilactobacillus cholophilus TaxID=3050131 RepID=UPI0025B013BE|nr:helix-turn-helix transcriptional regulator [Ligilactobacillus cholophilus]